MPKSIERKIRFQAALIYIIVTVVITATVIYLNNLRGEFTSKKDNIEVRHDILSFTNELVYTVSESQSYSGLYLLSKNRSYITKYREAMVRVNVLLDTLSVLKPEEELRFMKIDSLLSEQSKNFTKLNKQLSATNPAQHLTDKLKSYTPPEKDDTLILNVISDTLLNEVPKKSFIRRLGEVFKPGKDSVKMVVSQRVDTIRANMPDSLEYMYVEVEDIARQTAEVYEKSLKDIERQVSKLITVDKSISGEILTLLMDLQRETLDGTLNIIEDSKASIERNYLYSVIGAVIALVLILFVILMIFTDLGKGYRAKMELQLANDKIKRTMESRHTLLLSVSHDIKTPLSSIVGYLDMMGKSSDVASMKNSASHILAMLENLLEYSSLEKGSYNITPSEFDVLSMAEEIYDMFSPLANAKGIELRYDAPHVFVKGDMTKIKQVVVNLLSNAVKYTKEGEISLIIRVDSDKLKITVKDSGAGIPARYIDNLFTPFTRVEENNNMASGTGLGLFVVKGIVDQMKGDISVISQVGMGSAFDIVIPAEFVSNGFSENIHTIIPEGLKRIKIIDDDPAMLRVVSMLVSKLGHIPDDDKFDIIITDMEMGDISGIDILKGAGDIPVILMTGSSEFSLSKALGLGFAGYLSKPISLNSLKSLIGEGETFESSFGEEFDEIKNVLMNSSRENMEQLRFAYDTLDYDKAQFICHKMLPSFIELGYSVEELVRMDMNKGAAYELWRDDVNKILSTDI